MDEEEIFISEKKQSGANEELTDATILSLNSNSKKKVRFTCEDYNDNDDMSQLTDTVTKDQYEGSDSGI